MRPGEIALNPAKLMSRLCTCQPRWIMRQKSKNRSQRLRDSEVGVAQLSWRNSALLPYDDRQHLHRHSPLRCSSITRRRVQTWLVCTAWGDQTFTFLSIQQNHWLFPPTSEPKTRKLPWERRNFADPAAVSFLLLSSYLTGLRSFLVAANPTTLL